MAATGAATADVTASPFVCGDDVVSATVDCAGPAVDAGATLVMTMPAADAAGGCVLVTWVPADAAADARDVDDWVTLTAGADWLAMWESADCFNSRSCFTCVTMLVIWRDIVLTSASSTNLDFTWHTVKTQPIHQLQQRVLDIPPTHFKIKFTTRVLDRSANKWYLLSTLNKFGLKLPFGLICGFKVSLKLLMYLTEFLLQTKFKTKL